MGLRVVTINIDKICYTLTYRRATANAAVSTPASLPKTFGPVWPDFPWDLLSYLSSRAGFPQLPRVGRKVIPKMSIILHLHLHLHLCYAGRLYWLRKRIKGYRLSLP